MAEKFVFEPTDVATLKSTYDVIIIGSGGTGLTSALQAFELGLSPVILEKMPKIGGNTTRASSGMNAAETSVQLQHHIVDSMDAFYQETYDGGGQLNNPAMLRYFTQHGALAIDWLAQHGIVLDDLTITGGMSTMRTHRPSSMAPIGGFLVTELLKQIAAHQIPLVTDVKVDEITMAAGKVTGVAATAGQTTLKLSAPAVILATGGFGASQQIITQYRPDLAGYQTTNQPGATGDGLHLAQAVGAQLVDMDQVQVHPTVQQDTDHAFLIGEAVRGEGAILVNQQGQRFVNELDTRKNVTTAIDALNGTGAYLIFDRAIRDRVKAVEFYDHVGLVKTAETIETLADTIQVDGAVLEQTVTAWNQAVAQQNDGAYGRTTGMERAIDAGPYYAIHIAPAIHYTMGGVKINAQTQVLNAQDQPIDGLFAAGEVAGGLHGNNRIGGNSIAETVIFGRQAGQQAFRYVDQQR